MRKWWSRCWPTGRGWTTPSGAAELANGQLWLQMSTVGVEWAAALAGGDAVDLAGARATLAHLDAVAEAGFGEEDLAVLHRAVRRT